MGYINTLKTLEKSINKFTIYFISISIVISSVFFYSLSNNVFKKAKASFTPSFVRSLEVNNTNLFNGVQFQGLSGVWKWGELTDISGITRVYAVMMMRELNGNPYWYSPVLMYDTDGTWKIAFNDMEFGDEGVSVSFYKNHLLAFGNAGCGTGLNGGAYNSKVCNLKVMPGGTLSLVERISMTVSSGGGTWQSSSYEYNGNLYITNHINADGPHYLSKIDDLNTNDDTIIFGSSKFVINNINVGIIRKCTYKTSSPSNWDCQGNLRNTSDSDDTLIFKKIIKIDSTGIFMEASHGTTNIVEVDFDGFIINSKAFAGWPIVIGDNTRVYDSITIGANTYIVYQHLGSDPQQTITVHIIKTADFKIWDDNTIDSYPRSQVQSSYGNLPSRSYFLQYNNSLLMGYSNSFVTTPICNNSLLENVDPTNVNINNNNNWNRIDLNSDPANCSDLHLENMYYSSKLGKIFGAPTYLTGSKSPTIWIQNTITSPSVLPSTVYCNNGNPYRINFNMNSKAVNGNIISNSVVLTSKSDGSTINYDTSSIDPFSPISDYKITRTAFTPAPTANWSFFIDFTPGSNYFNSFYNNNRGFDISYTITDSFSSYTLNTSTPLITGAGLDPAAGCTTPFFKSGNGSFRTNESIGSTNAYWIKNINDGSSIRQNNGNDPFSVSDFAYESKVDPNSCKATLKGTKQLDDKFCVQIPGDSYSITRENTIKNITDQEFRNKQKCDTCILNDPLNGVKYFTITVNSDGTYDVNPKLDSNYTPIPNPYASIYNSLFPGNDPNTFTIDFSALERVNLLETYINFVYNYPIKNIIIKDDNNNAAPGTVGVNCEIKDCKMNIMSYKAYPPSSVAFDKAKDKVSYDQGFKTTQVNKIRTYVNYHDGEISSSNTSPSTNTREINLISTDNSMSNYYMGNFYTNGFLYTDKSKYTSIIKGNIVSRGIVSYSTNGLLSGTSFRDYNKPFLYMEYDPKFYIPYNILEKRIGTDIKYLGL